ncbi:Ubl carboxyl-terminal hydrolase 18 [Camelus dromedarius]|uniref:Ubl carboxyl-terminal hydrolase 18 n=1 Tax=Camelus dromedarius TaxID=9838 RepID=A0A5N4C843_CAMDR|nr:Ubl carboxyl-terminal hydrolase 18 [Camelus dromedarius]
MIGSLELEPTHRLSYPYLLCCFHRGPAKAGSCKLLLEVRSCGPEGGLAAGVLGFDEITMGPVGLHNLGQTCCLNSLIQVLAMNVEFTKILKRITVPRGAEEQKRSVPFQLLLLLEKMQDCRQKAVQPMQLAYCLQKYKVPVRQPPAWYGLGHKGVRSVPGTSPWASFPLWPVFVQHDAAQLYLTVWNLIKDQITDVDLVARLQALYTIRVKESFVCLECSMESCRDSSMLTLPLSLFDLDLKPLKTLVLKLTHLPQTLTIHLMRFCLRNLQTQKICHSLHFPQSLDLKKHLETEEDPCAAEEPRGGQYELFAVIAHTGTADFGHYCAYVWSCVDGQWFCFNDSNVSWVSWEDVQCTYGSHSYRCLDASSPRA